MPFPKIKGNLGSLICVHKIHHSSEHPNLVLFLHHPQNLCHPPSSAITTPPHTPKPKPPSSITITAKMNTTKTELRKMRNENIVSRFHFPPLFSLHFPFRTLSHHLAQTIIQKQLNGARKGKFVPNMLGTNLEFVCNTLSRIFVDRPNRVGIGGGTTSMWTKFKL